jgi:uroporphyrinogen-III synthase
MRVIVTRPESESRRWAGQLRARGFDVVELPLIEILPAAQPGLLDSVWRRLDSFHAVMFVSGTAVRCFFAQRPAPYAWPSGVRGWATGTGTRQALIDAGVEGGMVDSPPADAVQFDSETLWRVVQHQVGPGQRVLIVRGGEAGQDGGGRDWLAASILAAGGEVETVIAYVRAPPSLSHEQLEQARQGAESGCVWLFSSSQAIAHLQSMLPGQDWSRARALATHPRIALAARNAGFGVVCESRPTQEAVGTALESFR